MSEEETKYADIIIVGTGVAGAILGAKLVESGFDILLLEAGSEIIDREKFVKNYASAPVRIPSSPYKNSISDLHAPTPKVLDSNNNGHYIQKSSSTPFKSTYQKILGGSTWHWLGNVPRFIPTDFKMKTNFGIGDDWPISYNDLEKYYCLAEQELGVSGDHEEWNGTLGAFRSKPFPMPPIWATYSDHLVSSKLNNLDIFDKTIKLRINPQARNSTPYDGRPSCSGNSSCVPICPIGAKYDASVHIDKILKPQNNNCHPGKIQCRSIVMKLNHDSNGNIESAEYIKWTKDGKKRTKHTIKGKIFILAANAIETPLILLESKIGSTCATGKYLMDHLQGYGGAILKDPVYPFRGPPVTSGIDAFRDGAFRKKHSAFRISIGNDAWGRLEPISDTVYKAIFNDGLTGKELVKSLNHRITRMIRMSYSTEMLPESINKVEHGGYDTLGNIIPKISFSLPDYNETAFKIANQVLSELLSKIGATEVKYSYPNKNYSGAGHIMGTCRMGDNLTNSVVDKNCKVHNVNNLFISGSSVFTTSGTANPTLTIIALALRQADYIINKSKSLGI